MARRPRKIKEQPTTELAEMSAQLEDLQEALEAHLRSLGVAGIEELDEETGAEIDKLRPKGWLRESANYRHYWPLRRLTSGESRS